MRNRDYFNYKIYQTGLLAAVLVTALFLAKCTSNNTANSSGFGIEVFNPASVDRNQVFVGINERQINQLEADVDLSKLIVYQGDKEIPSQFNDNKLLFIVDQLKSNEKVKLNIKTDKSGKIHSYPKRTQAELSVKTGGEFENRKYIGGDFENINYLRVPDEHTDHSYYIRYEGPGWESDLVGYRFYLDWRNATDVFGKKTSDVVLQQVGLDGFDSYHEMQDWGVDVLKVGKSLGIGSLGTFIDEMANRVDKVDSVTCQILENGDIYSAINTDYFGWKVGQQSFDIKSKLSIHGGTRLTHHEILISDTPDNLCTGIVKDKNARLYTDQGNGDKWGYLATYGVQSLNNDKLGLAIFFSNKNYKGITEDEFSHIVKLNTEENKLDYYFLAAWEGEKDGIATEEVFLTYVKKTAIELANPVEITLKKL